MLSKELLKQKIMGHGFIEEHSVIDSWRIRGFFSVGAYSHLGHGTNIWNALIGRFCRIDANVTIGFRLAEGSIFSNHYFSYSEDGSQKNNPEYKKIKASRFFYDKQPLCFIGNDVRIHQGTIINAGVTIGNGAIIYPNSVVTEDVPPYSIVAGNPGKIISFRFSEDIIKKIENTLWHNLDLSFFEKMTNFADIDDVFIQIDKAVKKDAKYKISYVNSYTGQVVETEGRKLVIGPSHINDWQDKINSGDRKDPGFVLFGVYGMSIHQSYLKKLINWFLFNFKQDVILLVPDFRIGNTLLVNNENKLDPLFISKGLISDVNDKVLYEKSIEVLDEITSEFNDKLKLIFWCLIGRESLNKSEGKYVVEGKYEHPIWNYKLIKEKYSLHILQIDDIDEGMERFIIPNGTIHPNDDGYDLLEREINKS